MFWKKKKKKLDKKTLRVMNNVLEKGLVGILSIGPKDMTTAEGVDYKHVLYMVREKAQLTLDFVRDYGETDENKKINNPKGKKGE